MVFEPNDNVALRQNPRRPISWLTSCGIRSSPTGFSWFVPSPQAAAYKSTGASGAALTGDVEPTCGRPKPVAGASIAERIDVVHEAEQVGHREVARRCRRQRRLPVLHLPEERILVAVDEADEDLRHDDRADWAEPLAVVADLGLLEDVVPERRRLIQALLLGDLAVGRAVAVRGDLVRR